ncbi:MAG: DNA polymerase III subunit alpha [Deltaproteobacteria bacterium]|nr:MAG: DNA polymerase III subunit alpha [Deltaproteobacteria bacterium]
MPGHANFTHLHLHTEYSLLDGAIRLPDLFQKAKELRLPSLAMTDHGAMYGTVEFYKAAMKAGVKPIIGCEAYVAPGRMGDRTPGPDGENYYHLILLARNQEGYSNLCRLVSAANRKGFYYKPRIDKEILQELSGGLIGLTACLQGEVPFNLRRGRVEKAKQVAEEYAGIFGEGNFYFELMENGFAEQKEVNSGLIDLGRELSIPLVATNDCHYLEREDALSHEVLLCIQMGKTMADEKRMRMETDALYVRSPEEMSELFAHCPEAITNTIEIANRCNVELNFNTYHFPKYDTQEDESLADCMDRLSREGLQKRLEHFQFDSPEAEAATRKSYEERLETELRVIREMDFPGYFLIVQDFINWAKENDVAVGPGRGSAAGSLVAWALRITNIDPIPYDLLFERFLNPERISMPDIDVDFCFENRQKVIDYVTSHYGSDQVAQITTFGKMLARAVIRDVGRALDVPLSEVDRIAKLVPDQLGITLKEALVKEPEIKKAMDADPRIAELIKHALRLEGLNRHASTHAAGIVISDKPLENFLPVYNGKEGETVTQFAMKAVESIGLIKFDFLGLKTLTVIETALDLIAKSHPGEEPIDIDHIPMDDAAVYDLLSRGETTGVFQLESSGMKELMVNLRPSVFEDIIALVALYRPGPLGSGMVEDFIRRKHGEIPTVYELEQLEPILKDSYGIILYQEQVMKVAQVIANYSLGEADLLRRAMGKKIAEEMEKQKERFLTGARENKIPEAKAVKIFDLMAEFAKYGFNKSHSAAYALIAYQTAYLKAHYPVEFMASLLTNDRAHSDKIVKNLNECREMHIEVLPPDINESDIFFSVSAGKIRFGLAAVKNVGEGAIESIIEARDKEGPFTGLVDFAERVDLKRVNRKVTESLINCGAFDSLGGLRSQYLAYLDLALERASVIQKDRARGQFNFFDALAPEPSGNEDDEGTDSLPDLPDLSPADKLRAEKELLGFYVSGHPLREWSELLAAHTDGTIAAIVEGGADKSQVTLGGSVASLKEKITKNGKKMAFVLLEDMEGAIEIVVFPNVYEATMEHLRSEEPIIVRGSLERGDDAAKVLADRIVPLAEATEVLTRSVRIKFNAGLHSEADVNALTSVLASGQFRGECPVRIDVEFPGKGTTVLKVPEKYWVAPSAALKKSISDLFGAQVLTFR